MDGEQAMETRSFLVDDAGELKIHRWRERLR